MLFTERMNEKKIPTVNRELSWLSFNGRVLQEAEDPTVPLVERMKFLGIFSNNLDEFFRIRVATLRRFVSVGKGVKRVFGERPRKVLERIQRMVLSYQNHFDRIFEQLKEELAAEGIYLIDESRLDADQAQFLRNYFRTAILPYLAPIFPAGKSSFPQLVDQSIYFAIRLMVGKNPQERSFALMEIPTDKVSRFICLPSMGRREHYIILLDDVIRFCFDQVFAILPYDTFEAYTFKITRDAELDVDNDISESLIEKIDKGLKNRKTGAPVRMAYDGNMPDDMLKLLVKGLALDDTDYIIPGGRYHNFRDFIGFPSLGRTDLLYPAMEPIAVPLIEQAHTVFDAIAQRDFILHYPYHSFSYYIRMLREAAMDPNVLSISITLYRVATESRVVHALINAAQNGKKVTAVVEPRARFDEKANIYWSKKMQDAGVNVVLGISGLKVHGKMTLIKRREGRRTVSYATLSTGNFHEGNANLYTDVNLFTMNPNITGEVDRVFVFLEHTYKVYPFKYLWVSPLDMREKLYMHIDTEIANALKGKEAFILCKINNLVDERVIARLYKASQAGVKIKLVVRGICSLVPGVEGVSRNIEVVSIVDRFLEHSRIFIFGNGGEELCYISSADWMTRNLDHRVEVVVPILDRHLVAELRTVIEYALRDNVKARIVNQVQNNFLRKPSGSQKPFRSQMELYGFYSNRSE